MRLKIWLLLTISLGFIFPLKAQQIVWTNDYETAVKLAKESGKPMLLDFTASWCAPCRLMEKSFWIRPDVAELSKKVVFVKLDADKNAALKTKYNVRGLPNVILTDSWGANLDSHTGFGQNGDRVIIEKITNLPKDFSELKEAGKLLEIDKNNLKALHQFADFYQQKKLYPFSINIYQKILKLESEPLKRENTMLNLAYNHLRLGHLTLALENFEILRKEFPKSLQADMFVYGIILAQINKRNLIEAESYFAKLKTEFPQSKLISQAEDQLSKLKSPQK